MDLEERKQYVESAREAAPPGLTVVEEPGQAIPDEHEYAVVEILEKSDHGTTFLYVATGNREGICWAWQHAQDNHPRPDALQILNLDAVRGQRIDFH